MEQLVMVSATTFLIGAWTAAIGSFWGRPQHLDTKLNQQERRRRQAVGERIALIGWVLLLLGLVSLSGLGLIAGWRWAL